MMKEMLGLLWIVLPLPALLASGSPMPRAPRLELSVVSLPPPAWAGTPQAAGIAVPLQELRLRLVNEGDRPVEAEIPEIPVPEVTDEGGKAAAFSDWRSVAGFAPPQPPRAPAPPLRPGEARQLGTYTVLRTAQGVQLRGPHGDAPLGRGSHKVRVALALAPVTRERWMAAYRAALPRRAAEAEREAGRYAAHWREVPGYWSGRLESNTVVLQVP